MKEFKTTKGTTLYLLDLKGKDYLPVQERLIWFREEKPTWQIHTSLVKLDDKQAIVKASILNDQNQLIATAHKSTDKKPFMVELSETGAVGRALALIGYGTQFCGEDLFEGDNIADAPREPLTGAKINTVIPYTQEQARPKPEPVKEIKVGWSEPPKKAQKSGVNCQCGNEMLISSWPKHEYGSYYCGKCKESFPMPKPVDGPQVYTEAEVNQKFKDAEVQTTIDFPAMTEEDVPF